MTFLFDKYSFLKIVLGTILLLFFLPNNAQNPSIEIDSLLKIAKTDSSLLTDSLQKTTVFFKKKRKGGKSKRQRKANRSAGKALLWALVPGGGQAYNRQYWKAPLFAGGVVGASFWAINRHSVYRKNLNNYLNLRADTSIPSDSSKLAQLDLFRQQKNKAFQSYNWAVNAAIFSYGFGLLDTYISYQLQKETKRSSPLKAAYYAIVLPGMGQVYNKKYWKLPIVYAGFGVAGYFIYTNLQSRNRYRDEYWARTRLDYGDRDPRLAGITNPNDLLTIKNFYRRNLEFSIAGAAAWYLLTIADAIVDAHLQDFDISDDLSLHVQPYVVPSVNQQPSSGGVSVVLGF